MRLLRLEAKLLTANARLEHQATRAHGEDGDAVVVVCGLRSALFKSDRRCTCRKLVVAALEVIERRLVLEEYDLAVGLAAEFNRATALPMSSARPRRIARSFGKSFCNVS
jgi:hypothetical protein